MGIAWNIVRVALTAIIIVAVAEISRRFPRYGALLLSLPIVSILAFILSWTEHRDLPAIARLAKETLVLVPLGLPFFLPFVFAERWGMDFWMCFVIGLMLASCTIGIWFWAAPTP